MFPHSAVSALKEARNGDWSELVDRIEQLDEADSESLAFALLMIRLCGCLNCQPGGFKLSLGCRTCAFRAVAGFKGNDAALLRNFRKAHKEIEDFLATREATTQP